MRSGLDGIASTPFRRAQNIYMELPSSLKVGLKRPAIGSYLESLTSTIIRWSVLLDGVRAIGKPEASVIDAISITRRIAAHHRDEIDP